MASSNALGRVLTLLLITSVSRAHEAVPLLAQLHPALVLALLALLIAVLHPSWLRMENVLASWPGRIVVALAVLACISAPFGLSLGASAMYILTDYSKVVMFAVLLMAGTREVKDLRLFTWGYVVACAILVWMALFVFSLSRSHGSLVSRLGGLYTYDSNDIGCLLVVGLALSLALFQTSRSSRRWLYLLVIAGIGGALARSGSRGGLLALIGAGAALLILQSHVPIKRRLGAVAVIALGLVAFAPPGYWEQMGTMLSPKQDYNWDSVDGRREVAKRGIGYMMSYPAFGVGIGNFQRAEGTISGKAPHTHFGTGLKWTAPHNSFIQAGAELGIPGMILWVSLVFGGVVAMIRLRARLPRAWLRAGDDFKFVYVMTTYLAVALIGFMIAAFFVSFAFLDLVYVLAAFMSGLYTLLRRPDFSAALSNAQAARRVVGRASRGALAPPQEP